VDDRRHRSAYVASVVVVSLHTRPVPGPAPAVAGRYALLDQIGAGGMGSVWRARDTRTGDVVAVKVLGRHSASLLARFVREQAIRVRHPHVVAPTGWAAEDDLVLLAMDLVPGGSVQQLLDEHGPLPVGYAARLLEQLLMALAAVHAAGLVHRDVKPANLLLDATGAGDPHLRLGDFGVAAPIADRRFTTVPGAIGTDGYMAPEQARGAPPDPCQDLYAVGRVGLQLLTGLPPARQGEIGSSRLRPLLERLLVVDPEQRLASAAAALRLLRRLDVPAEPGPAVPDRLPPLPRGRRGRPGRRTRSAADRPGLHRSRTDWPAWLGVAGCVGALLACAVVVARVLG
jgi:eukaryotic-like serine/threonine-protein kinase